MPLSVVSRVLPGWGITYGPPGDGPFPAVMVLHGSLSLKLGDLTSQPIDLLMLRLDLTLTRESLPGIRSQLFDPTAQYVLADIQVSAGLHHLHTTPP